jgi:hypothetical protein
MNTVADPAQITIFKKVILPKQPVVLKIYSVPSMGVHFHNYSLVCEGPSVPYKNERVEAPVLSGVPQKTGSCKGELLTPLRIRVPTCSCTLYLEFHLSSLTITEFISTQDMIVTGLRWLAVQSGTGRPVHYSRDQRGMRFMLLAGYSTSAARKLKPPLITSYPAPAHIASPPKISYGTVVSAPGSYPPQL